MYLSGMNSYSTEVMDNESNLQSPLEHRTNALLQEAEFVADNFIIQFCFSFNCQDLAI